MSSFHVENYRALRRFADNIGVVLKSEPMAIFIVFACGIVTVWTAVWLIWS